MYGNQKQYERRYSRILTDITRAWVEGNPLPCRQVGTRAKAQTIKQKYSLLLKRKTCECLLEIECMWSDLFFCVDETNEGKPREDHHRSKAKAGHHTEATSDHRTDTKKTAMPTRTLSPQTRMISFSQIKIVFASCSLSNPPTHGNQQENTCHRTREKDKSTVG